MNFIKRAYWSVTVRKGKSIILLVVLAVISVFVLTGLTIQTAAEESSILARQELGGDVTLTVDRQSLVENGVTERRKQAMFQTIPIDIEDAESLIDSEHVEGFNFYSATSAMTNDFTAIGAEEREESTIEDGQDQGSIMPGRMGNGSNADLDVQGVLYSDAATSFINGQSEIVEGEHLTADDAGKKVTMVEGNLASENGWSIGDEISVTSEETEESVTLEIKGIYSTSEEVPPQAERILSMNPYNSIYVPIEVANQLKGEEGIIDQAIYYINDPLNIDAFIEEAKSESTIDFDTFILNANDQLYQQMMGPIENVSSFSNKIVLLVTIAGSIILGLIVMMTIRERKYEMGVLLAIGEKRIKLVGQFIVEILIVAVLAMGLSLITGNYVADAVGNQLLEQELTATEESDEPQSFAKRRGMMGGMEAGGNIQNQDVQTIEEISIGVTAANIILMVGIGLLCIIVSTLVPVLSILRMNPKTILTNQD
ncbi:ABC transporter permease [Jeotgalibacillus sp. S-D1]|uniref:ABC transporter permease n=1 Tax=Jeotgalibacillus sp. S-D1 TaxID=2552189 RepID=UPI00105A40C1|nr:ABC transporter permease [Jeotgalibacillus sp. S-D1]TDL31953.1 ABC transporter permease [Jeotgalibacillus sp. S-D1]